MVVVQLPRMLKRIQENDTFAGQHHSPTRGMRVLFGLEERATPRTRPRQPSDLVHAASFPLLLRPTAAVTLALSPHRDSPFVSRILASRRLR